MGFWEGLTEAMDDIRHQVVEQPMYGKEVTGDIELPQQEAATEQPANKWNEITQDMGAVQPPEPPAPDMGMER